MTTARMALAVVRAANEKLATITCTGRTADVICDVQILLQLLESILEGCVLCEEGGKSNG